ncbi:alanine racemase C-terminal domain-containing protein [Microbacterium terrisoli]|jgi:alanine racemase|uniref:alanine racemase C-terminal domain-containing protein n=1 Tax=Microbacterium terrisoli TaxID=3242192 RepID=UPI0028045420|nr:alanine racemase C-terminal domain-containing protein [Microbacterium protaetiae]
MTATGRPAPVRALISMRALAGNAAQVRAGGATYADVRRDAWGHGLLSCAQTLIDAGLALRVDEAQREAVAALGGTVDLRAGGEDGPAADLHTLWGLPGGRGRPVMRLHGSILSTKVLRTGEGVSYGYLFRAPHDTVVGLVSGGYAQGIVRQLGGTARVRVGAAAAPIVGRVAMDACVIDLEGVDAAAGDDVAFFGEPAAGEPGLDDWLRATGLRAAEIVSLVGARAQREVTA